MAPFRINLIILLYGIIHSSWALSKSSRGKGNPSFRQYNEHCVLYSSSSPCNSSQGLMCLDSGLKGYRCLCPSNKLHAQLYDSKRNACVGKVFNACVVPGRNRNGGDSREALLNQSLCVENAECNTATYGMAICLCKPGFTEKDDGTCVPSLKYGESCGDDGDNDNSETTTATTTTERSGRAVGEDSNMKEKKCDEKHGLACIDSKCQCRFPSEQYYDEKEGKCISYAEGRCTHETHIYSCVPNANCPAPPLKINVNGNGLGLPPLLPPFLSGFGIHHHHIAGDRGDEEGGEEIFVMPFRPPPRMPSLPGPPPPHHLPPIRSPFHGSHSHAFASAGSHQHPLLSKQDPLMDFDSMRFDDIDFAARSIIFGSQKTNSEEGERKGGDSKEDHHPRCQCLPGFSRTAAGWCMKSYGSKCSPEDEESVKGNSTNGKDNGGTRELCNPDQFLECMDAHDGGSFTCQCRNQMNERYDPERKECVALVGRRCRPVGNYPKCDKGSECINGICDCANGTSLTPLDTCAKDYEETCQPGECNSWKGLMCHGKSRTCLCLDSYLSYEKGKGACVASKGNMCGSVRSSMKWGSGAGIMTIPETAYVECEQGTECKAREIGGKKMASRCA